MQLTVRGTKYFVGKYKVLSKVLSIAAVLAATPTVAERARETVERTAQVIGSRFLFCFWFKLRLHDEVHIYLTE